MEPIDPKIALFIHKVLQICIDNECTGFAGVFRDSDGFHNFYLEAPGFTDGACNAINEAICASIESQGLNKTRSFQGLILPPPGSDEMPH